MAEAEVWPATEEIACLAQSCSAWLLALPTSEHLVRLPPVMTRKSGHLSEGDREADARKQAL